MYTKRKLYHPMYAHLLNKCHNKDYSDCEPVHFSKGFRSVPAVNIIETEDEFKMSFAVPGMKKEDFKIKVDNDLLIVKADLKDEKDETVKYGRKEYNFKSFERKFRLPENTVDIDHISASYENGELFVIVAKKEEAKDAPPRDIEVK